MNITCKHGDWFIMQVFLPKSDRTHRSYSRYSGINSNSFSYTSRYVPPFVFSTIFRFLLELKKNIFSPLNCACCACFCKLYILIVTHIVCKHMWNKVCFVSRHARASLLIHIFLISLSLNSTFFLRC